MARDYKHSILLFEGKSNSWVLHPDKAHRLLLLSEHHIPVHLQPAYTLMSLPVPFFSEEGFAQEATIFKFQRSAAARALEVLARGGLKPHKHRYMNNSKNA
ncbi:hypothetical protein AVEN_77104-1 [Araneus ventricosus]|uniref:Uncharacterized protein n=1 Tax=Araneus ventricosus TaxID=182803 RepID=A0A4Y2M1S4_ARAVE|nr:hypothetical protein AVEN_77104-1 [Araneus ventricosus]